MKRRKLFFTFFIAFVLSVTAFFAVQPRNGGNVYADTTAATWDGLINSQPIAFNSIISKYDTVNKTITFAFEIYSTNYNKWTAAYTVALTSIVVQYNQYLSADLTTTAGVNALKTHALKTTTHTSFVELSGKYSFEVTYTPNTNEYDTKFCLIPFVYVSQFDKNILPQSVTYTSIALRENNITKTVLNFTYLEQVDRSDGIQTAKTVSKTFTVTDYVKTDGDYYYVADNGYYGNGTYKQSFYKLLGVTSLDCCLSKFTGWKETTDANGNVFLRAVYSDPKISLYTALGLTPEREFYVPLSNITCDPENTTPINVEGAYRNGIKFYNAASDWLAENYDTFFRYYFYSASDWLADYSDVLKCMGSFKFNYAASKYEKVYIYALKANPNNKHFNIGLLANYKYANYNMRTGISGIKFTDSSYTKRTLTDNVMTDQYTFLIDAEKTASATPSRVTTVFSWLERYNNTPFCTQNIKKVTTDAAIVASGETAINDTIKTMLTGYEIPYEFVLGDETITCNKILCNDTMGITYCKLNYTTYPFTWTQSDGTPHNVTLYLRPFSDMGIGSDLRLLNNGGKYFSTGNECTPDKLYGYFLCQTTFESNLNWNTYFHSYNGSGCLRYLETVNQIGVAGNTNSAAWAFIQSIYAYASTAGIVESGNLYTAYLFLDLTTNAPYAGYNNPSYVNDTQNAVEKEVENDFKTALDNIKLFFANTTNAMPGIIIATVIIMVLIVLIKYNMPSKSTRRRRKK